MRMINIENKCDSTKGFGLLDIMLALAVSAVVLVLAVAYYSNASTTQKINRTIQQIQQIRAVVQNQVSENSAQAKPSAFSSTNITSNLLAKNLINPSTVTSVWDKSSIQITAQNGSIVTKAGGTSSTVTCFRINITICGVSPGSVNKLTSRYMASFTESSPAETAQGKCMVFSSCLD